MTRRENIERLQNVLETITYKPKHLFYLNDLGEDRLGAMTAGWVRFLFMMDVIDVDSGKRGPYHQWYNHLGDPFLNISNKDFIHWVYKKVVRNEIHEIHEFFKVDGECYINPHPKDRVDK